jgi:hypothetical protein
MSITAETFGTKNIGKNYGWVFLGQTGGAPCIEEGWCSSTVLSAFGRSRSRGGQMGPLSGRTASSGVSVCVASAATG